MKDLYTLTLYDNLGGYLQGFFIGVFASYDETKSIAKKYLNKISGFKDYSCQYEIKTKKVVGEVDTSETVSMVWGWNTDSNMNEVDIWESDLYANEDEAQMALTIVQKKMKRQEWCVDIYKVGECFWREGFVREKVK